jgi:TRAP-type mannitol/chloroaromatic compound transport system substrate-binding protein
LPSFFIIARWILAYSCATFQASSLCEDLVVLRTLLNALRDLGAWSGRWKAIDRYSQDYVELQTKDKVKFYKTPDAILKRQLEIFDDIVKKYSETNPLFKEIVESQIAFARRATQWEQDTVVNRKMAFDHYFGPKGTARKT